MLSSLEQSFKALEASKSALLNRLSALSADCINQRPNPGAWSLAEIAPVLLLDVDAVVLRGLLDVGEGQVTLGVRDILHLIEASTRVSGFGLPSDFDIRVSALSSHCPSKLLRRD